MAIIIGQSMATIIGLSMATIIGQTMATIIDQTMAIISSFYHKLYLLIEEQNINLFWSMIGCPLANQSSTKIDLRWLMDIFRVHY